MAYYVYRKLQVNSDKLYTWTFLKSLVVNIVTKKKKMQNATKSQSYNVRVCWRKETIFI